MLNKMLPLMRYLKKYWKP